MMKRTFDIIAAFLGLVVCSPIFIVAAILIKLDSSGPIFFKQVRVGRWFRHFSIYKFRTMFHDTSQKGASLTIGTDSRITRVGLFLRRYKIDELPQLINIIQGDMSVVGPRPEVPPYVHMFREDYAKILTVRPGLTDLATLHYINEEEILGTTEKPEEEYVQSILPEKVRLSSQYVTGSTFLLDLIIILETLLRLFGFKSFFLDIHDTGQGGMTNSDRSSLRTKGPGTFDQVKKPFSPFESGRGLVALRVVFDGFCAAIALALAFLTHMAMMHFLQSGTGLTLTSGMLYVNAFGLYVGPVVVLSVISLALLGVYRIEHQIGYDWKKAKILASLSFPPILGALFFYLVASVRDPSLPAGVSLLVWLYLVLFLGGPRIIKYYILTKMVVSLHHHRREKVRNVLVIGGGGYIGSQLCRDLLERGYGVRILDTFVFGDSPIRDILAHKSLDVVCDDFRSMEAVLSSMDGMDAVVHLGGLVGDPACAIDDDQTLEINLTATRQLAEMCKVLQIERFVFASSCSVYGAGGEEELSESSPLNPVSLYARTKIASEKILLEMASSDFSPIILRFSTLFGLSPRPRFDLVVNLLTAQAVKEGRIFVTGGSQWRPFVHVRDVCKAIVAVLEAPKRKVSKEIFNVGSNENNFRIINVAEKILAAVPRAKLEIKEDQGDRRHYKVSFRKLSTVLGLHLGVSVDEGIRELRDAFSDHTIENYADAQYSNVKQTQKVLTDCNGTEKGERSRDVLSKGPLRQTAKSFLARYT